MSKTLCPILSAVEVEYSYPDGTVALRGASLILESSDFCVLVGPNGSGKTTLAMMLSGLLMPRCGEVLVNGIPTHDFHRGGLADKVAVSFQNPDHQLFSTTVEEEIGFAPSVLRYPENRRKKLIKSSIELLGIQHLKKRHPFNISFGQRHLVSLAATFAQDTAVIILDEPTRGLDRVSRDMLASALHELAGSGRAVLVITHDLDWAWEHASKVALINRGKVVKCGGFELLSSGVANRLNCTSKLAMLDRELGSLSGRSPGGIATIISRCNNHKGGVT